MLIKFVIIQLFLSFIALIPLFFTGANGFGFSTNLIHRDSPKSPFYNSSLSHLERVTFNLKRSRDRVNHFTTTYIHRKLFSSKIIPSAGEYIMYLKVGTPPYTILGLADTGSDLIWTQCSPCKSCFPQKAPLFDPKSSKSYQTLPCQSNACQGFFQIPCDASNICQYQSNYADGSYTRGILASDTVTLNFDNGKPAFFPNISFGCGFENGGRLSEFHNSGVVGLGAGPLSLISQLNNFINGKFSYCMVPWISKNKMSEIHFGDNAIVSGSGVVNTPLFTHTNLPFHYLHLEGLTIGDQRLDYFDPNPFSSSGNIILDSGTTMIYLPVDYYNRVKLLVSKMIKVAPITDLQKDTNLCYNSRDNPSYPSFVAHFTGADVELSPLNTFIQVEEEVVCLGFNPSEKLFFWGNNAQINFLIGYDLNKRTVSFKGTECGGF